MYISYDIAESEARLIHESYFGCIDLIGNKKHGGQCVSYVHWLSDTGASD